MARTEKEKMLAGELYRPGDPELQAEMAANKIWMAEYNSAMAASADERRALLRRRLGFVGEGAVIWTESKGRTRLRLRISYLARFTQISGG